jgi:hypothetical protein
MWSKFHPKLFYKPQLNWKALSFYVKIMKMMKWMKFSRKIPDETDKLIKSPDGQLPRLPQEDAGAAEGDRVDSREAAHVR